MIKELRSKLNQVEESRKNLDYALDMLQDGVGYKPYSNIGKEIELVALLNNKIADYLLDLVDQQEGLDITLESLLTVELGLDKKEVEDDDEIPF